MLASPNQVTTELRVVAVQDIQQSFHGIPKLELGAHQTHLAHVGPRLDVQSGRY